MLFLMSNSIANLEKEKYNKYKKVTYIHFEIFFLKTYKLELEFYCVLIPCTNFTNTYIHNVSALN